MGASPKPVHPPPLTPAKAGAQLRGSPGPPEAGSRPAPGRAERWSLSQARPPSAAHPGESRGPASGQSWTSGAWVPACAGTSGQVRASPEPVHPPPLTPAKAGAQLRAVLDLRSLGPGLRRDERRGGASPKPVHPPPLTPAKAGAQPRAALASGGWVPACAGTSGEVEPLPSPSTLRRSPRRKPGPAPGQPWTSGAWVPACAGTSGGVGALPQAARPPSAAHPGESRGPAAGAGLDSGALVPACAGTSGEGGASPKPVHPPPLTPAKAGASFGAVLDLRSLGPGLRRDERRGGSLSQARPPSAAHPGESRGPAQGSPGPPERWVPACAGTSGGVGDLSRYTPSTLRRSPRRKPGPAAGQSWTAGAWVPACAGTSGGVEACRDGDQLRPSRPSIASQIAAAMSGPPSFGSPGCRSAT